MTMSTGPLLVGLPSFIELRDPALGRMLAARLRLDVLKDITETLLENTSADDFAARFLAIVARQVPEEAQATRDAYEAAVPVDAAVFRELSKDAREALIRVYLAVEAKFTVVKPDQFEKTTNSLPGERESERLLRLVQTVTEDLKATTEGAARAFRRAMTIIEQQQAEFAERLRGIIEQGFRARLEVYPKLAEKIVRLAQRGWFLSRYFGLSEIDQLAHSAIMPSPDELEQCILRLYEEYFTIHLNDIIHDYPEREFILRPAGDAHLRGEYALSVMAFFSQIDGICFETTKKYFFLRSNDQHVSSFAAFKLDEIRRDKDDDLLFHQVLGLLDGSMWLSIIGELPISFSENKRRNVGYDGINRHTVLHGTAMKEYATKENSLKAFSLLSYMASLAKSDGE
jgi:hypothetical protein